MNDQIVKQPELAKHDASILDLAFIMDCTGSMGSYILSATESIRKIVEEIVSLEKSDVRLALVEYRDHPPQENTFVTQVHDFTDSIKEMKKWLEACKAIGGGDQPEAVADGLYAALKLSWREKSTKICVLIADAPPHGINGAGDSFPNGCPDGIDPLDVVKKMAEKAITLYSVGCEPSLTPFKEFFSAMAFKTGGQYVPLRNAALLAKVIVGGAVEEISLEKLMGEVKEEIDKQRKNGITDEKVLAQAVEMRFQSQGVVTNQIMMNNSNLEKASENAIKYSKFENLADLRKDYKPNQGFGQMPYRPTSAHSAFDGAPRMAYCAMPMARPMQQKMASMVHPSSDAPPTLSEAPIAPMAGSDTYSINQSTINYSQSERLVQKALNRYKD